MVSLLNNDGPRLLWQFHDRRQSDLPGRMVSISSPGPDYFVWKTDSNLYCQHPLTGELLWERELISDERSAQLFVQRVDLTADEICTVVFGRTMQSYQLFSTRTGQHLHDGMLGVPPGQTPMVFGRNILFADIGRRLRLYDLLTEQDLMDPAAPLHVVEGTLASGLSDDRVVLLAEDSRIVVVNCQTGKTELASELRDDDISPRFAAVSGFERDGKLFVMLRDRTNRDPTRSAAPLLQEPRLASANCCALTNERDIESGVARLSLP